MIRRVSGSPAICSLAHRCVGLIFQQGVVLAAILWLRVGLKVSSLIYLFHRLFFHLNLVVVENFQTPTQHNGLETAAHYRGRILK